MEDNNTVFNNTINKDIYSPSEDEPTENDSINPKPDKYEDFVIMYHEICTKLPKVAKNTTKRKNKINKLLKEMSLDEIKKAFKSINDSRFCTGINERGWKASFDFCIEPDNLAKALEGKYNNSNNNLSQNNQKSKYPEL